MTSCSHLFNSIRISESKHSRGSKVCSRNLFFVSFWSFATAFCWFSASASVLLFPVTNQKMKAGKIFRLICRTRIQSLCGHKVKISNRSSPWRPTSSALYSCNARMIPSISLSVIALCRSHGLGKEGDRMPLIVLLVQL